MEKIIAGSFIVLIGVVITYTFFKIIKDIKEAV